MQVTKRCLLVLALFLFLGGMMPTDDEMMHIQVAAPVDTDSAGRGGDVAVHSVIRVICAERGTGGTGFLHKSGNLLTADHVVRGCGKPELLLPNGSRMATNIISSNQDHDLAILKPASPITATPLKIAEKTDFKVGAQVSTWGFPAGYFGAFPMLSVGYLSGIDAVRMQSGVIVKQWVVNAAFNGGNSGGPLVHIETGEVFGVVSSKLAPISKDALVILELLEKQQSGFTYSGKTADGKEVTFTEGQLVGRVLTELRSQVQLVIGKAVLLEDLTAFLKANNIDP